MCCVKRPRESVRRTRSYNHCLQRRIRTQSNWVINDASSFVSVFHSILLACLLLRHRWRTSTWECSVGDCVSDDILNANWSRKLIAIIIVIVVVDKCINKHYRFRFSFGQFDEIIIRQRNIDNDDSDIADSIVSWWVTVGIRRWHCAMFVAW